MKTKMLSFAKEVLKENKNRITIEEGRITITPPKEDVDLKTRKTVIFRCKNTESGKAENPPLVEVLPPFQK